ncbi:MAG: hypothetical protein AAB657_04550 [Patescibacteria group bacterium]
MGYIKLIFVITACFLLWAAPSEAAFKWPWQVKTEPVQAVKGITDTKAEVNQDSLKSGLAKVRSWENLVEAKPPRLNQKIQLEFTDKELLAILQNAANKLKTGTVEPRSVKLTISGDKITIKTRVLKPTKFNLELQINAKVKDGKLEPQIVYAKAGIIKVKGHVVEKLAKEIFGDKWREELNRPSFIWDSVIIKNDKVVVAGHTPQPKVKGVKKRR